MRLARACVLLEVIDDETGRTHAIGYDLAASVASINFDHAFTMNPADGVVYQKRPSEFHIIINGRGREFHMDLGTWFDTPPQRELSPAPDECPAGGEHTWAELETWDHKMGIGCDECGATYPREQ